MTRVLAAVVIPKKNAGCVSTGVDMPSVAEDFAAFWAVFPRRIGKRAAQQAYTIARRSVEQDMLLEAVARYIRYKPSWQQYCHPRTWLSQERWLDEYGAVTVPDVVDWWQQCKELHGGACAARYAHGLRMQIDVENQKNA